MDFILEGILSFTLCFPDTLAVMELDGREGVDYHRAGSRQRQAPCQRGRDMGSLSQGELPTATPTELHRDLAASMLAADCKVLSRHDLNEHR
jgi:hypothetical protein